MYSLDTQRMRYRELAGLHGHRVDLLRKELTVVEVLVQTQRLTDPGLRVG